MNKLFLFGNVGKDPEVKSFEGGNKVAKFSLATSTHFKDKAGEKKAETQWHNIVFWGKQADLCEKYVKKGSSLIIEGEVRYRTYESDGVTKYITEVFGNALHFAGKKQDESPQDKTPQAKDDWQGKKTTGAMSDINDLPGANESDNMPF